MFVIHRPLWLSLNLIICPASGSAAYFRTGQEHWAPAPAVLFLSLQSAVLWTPLPLSVPFGCVYIIKPLSKHHGREFCWKGNAWDVGSAEIAGTSRNREIQAVIAVLIAADGTLVVTPVVWVFQLGYLRK